MKDKYKEKNFTEIIKSSYCYADAMRKLGISDSAGNYRTLKKYIKRYNIDISHFDPMKKLREYSNNKKIPLEEILVYGSTYKSTKLKKRLYKTGLKKKECEICGQGEMWNGKTLVFHLDHIDGNNINNELSNLRIICPNCDTTLDTYGGRNSGKIFKKSKLIDNESNFVEIEDKPLNNCQTCGSKTDNEKYCCRECFNNRVIDELTDKEIEFHKSQRKIERPPYEQLVKEIEETNYSAVGRKYGVSDNAIRKWVKFYEKHEINNN